MASKRARGRAIQKRNRRILAANDTCHICGEPGADAVDHVLPLNPTGDATPGADEPWNLRPAHHNVPNSRGVKCNRVKGNKTPDPRLTTSRQW